jgi:hypothetical protein
MKEALIDDLLLVKYTDCFCCREILICSIVFLDIPAQHFHIDWSYALLNKSTKWRWTRTGNSECKRLCKTCAQRREHSIHCALKRAYNTSAFPRQNTIRTLADLIEKIGLGGLRSTGIKKGVLEIDRSVFIAIQNVRGSGHLDIVDGINENRMRPSYCIRSS